MSEKRSAIRSSSAAPRIALAGDEYQVLVRGEDTAGRYAVVNAIVPPGGGPPPHSHTREEEGFYVLEGELTVHADGNAFKAGPGTAVNLPVGSVHFFSNEGRMPARMLITVSPSGWEKMVEEAGTILRDGETPKPLAPEEIPRLLAVAPKYGITSVRP